MATGADQITEDTNVEDLITRFPTAARVFVRRRMGCVGCDIARFESLAEVCQVYRQPLDQFIAEINQILSQEGRHFAAPLQGQPVPGSMTDSGGGPHRAPSSQTNRRRRKERN